MARADANFNQTAGTVNTRVRKDVVKKLPDIARPVFLI